MLLFQPELPKQKDKHKRKQIGHNEKLIIPPLQVTVLFVYNFLFEPCKSNQLKTSVCNSMALCDLICHEPNLALLGVHPELLFGPTLSRHLVS